MLVGVFLMMKVARINLSLEERNELVEQHKTTKDGKKRGKKMLQLKIA